MPFLPLRERHFPVNISLLSASNCFGLALAQLPDLRSVIETLLLANSDGVATPSLFASNSVSITLRRSGSWASANPKQFEALNNEMLTGKWRSRKGRKGTVYGVINEVDDRGTIVLDGDTTFFY